MATWYENLRLEFGDIIELLENNGFGPTDEPGHYLNRSEAKVFSSRAITDRPIEWFQERIRERNSCFAVYYSESFSKDVYDALAQRFRLQEWRREGD